MVLLISKPIFKVFFQGVFLIFSFFPNCFACSELFFWIFFACVCKTQLGLEVDFIFSKMDFDYQIFLQNEKLWILQKTASVLAN